LGGLGTVTTPCEDDTPNIKNYFIFNATVRQNNRYSQRRMGNGMGLFQLLLLLCVTPTASG